MLCSLCYCCTSWRTAVLWRAFLWTWAPSLATRGEGGTQRSSTLSPPSSLLVSSTTAIWPAMSSSLVYVIRLIYELFPLSIHTHTHNIVVDDRKISCQFLLMYYTSSEVYIIIINFSALISLCGGHLHINHSYKHTVYNVKIFHKVWRKTNVLYLLDLSCWCAGISRDWGEGVWWFSLWDTPSLLPQQGWHKDTHVHCPQEGVYITYFHHSIMYICIIVWWIHWVWLIVHVMWQSHSYSHTVAIWIHTTDCTIMLCRRFFPNCWIFLRVWSWMGTHPVCSMAMEASTSPSLPPSALHASSSCSIWVECMPWPTSEVEGTFLSVYVWMYVCFVRVNLKRWSLTLLCDLWCFWERERVCGYVVRVCMCVYVWGKRERERVRVRVYGYVVPVCVCVCVCVWEERERGGWREEVNFHDVCWCTGSMVIAGTKEACWTTSKTCLTTSSQPQTTLYRTSTPTPASQSCLTRTDAPSPGCVSLQAGRTGRL